MALPTGVRKLASGRYQWRAEHLAQRRSGTAATAARAGRDRAQAIIEMGGTPTGYLTVDDLIDSWKAGVDHARQTAQARDYTLDQLPATFRARHAADVTAPIIAALWRELGAKGVGQTSLVKLRGYLSQAWIHGNAFGYVTGNPIRAVKVPTRTTSTVKPEDVPTPKQIAKLIAYFGNQRGTKPPLDPALAAWVAFAASTGARPPGEVCALRWDVIDWDNHRLRIGASVDRDGTITTGKNDDAGHRTVDVDAELLALLDGLERTGPYVWPNKRSPDEPRRPDSTGKEIAAAIKACGFKFRVYDLRHFFASQALAAGVPVPEVAHVMGDNPATVLRRYSHFVARPHGGAVGVVGALLRPARDNVVELRRSEG
jgi:integrase